MKSLLFTMLFCFACLNFSSSAFGQCLNQSALHFNGFPNSNNNFIETAGPVLPITANQPITIELWMKLQPYNGGGASLRSGLVSQYECCSHPLRFSLLQDADNRISYRNIKTTSVVADDTWHHYAVTRSAMGNVKVYLDGQLEATGVDLLAFTTFTFKIGQLPSNHVFEGAIDELRIWNTERSQMDIQADMNAVLTGNETDLELYYNFEDGIANGDNSGVTTITDLTGNHDASINNFLLTGTESNFTDGFCYVCQDQTAPVALCQDISITLDQSSSYTINPLEIDNGSFDDCPGLMFELSTDVLDCSDVGSISVDLIVTDASNNSTSCSSEITVADATLAPIAITPIDTLCANDDVIFEVSGFDFDTSFETVTISAAESGTRSIDVGDIDGDGDIDIAAASADSDEIALLFNDGSGMFTRTVIHAAADGAVSVEILDFDDDGDQDVLAASQFDNTIRVMLNDGAQQFTEQIISTNANDVRVAASIDIDNDGDKDIVASNWGSLVVYSIENLAVVGNFITSAPGISDIEIGDIDGDGLDDIVANRDIGGTNAAWYKNLGSALDTIYYSPFNQSFRNAVALGDIDDDNDLDILLTYSSGNFFTTYVNNGTGGLSEFPTGANQVKDIAIGDINGDGHTDFAHRSGFNVFFRLNDQNNQHIETTSLQIFSDWYTPHVVDFDNDGDNEVVAAFGGSIIAVDYDHWGIVDYQLDGGPVQQLRLPITNGKISTNLGVLSPGIHTLSVSAYACFTTTNVIEEFTVNDNPEQRWYIDADSDGFGDVDDNGTLTCLFLEGHTLDNSDCNDNDPDNFPGNTEFCDGQDNNCDGILDEGFISDQISFYDTLALGYGIIANEHFGAEVKALGNTMAVLAPGDNNNPDADGIYIFYRDGCDDFDWQFNKKIISPGVSTIAMTEEFIVAGQPFTDSLATNTGSITIYGRDVGGVDNWGVIQTTLASNWQQNSTTGLGREVAIQENTIAVNGYGRTYIFEKDELTNNWIEQNQLEADGNSLDFHGDLLVSSSRNENQLNGAVYLYERHKGGYNNWGLLKRITAEIGGAEQFLFGTEAKVSDDLLVVQSNHGAFTGNIHIFERDQGGPKNWGHTQTLIDTMITYQRGTGSLDQIDVRGDLIICGIGADNPDVGAKEAIVLKKDQCNLGEWGVIRKISAKEFTTNTRFTVVGSSVVLLDNQIIVGVAGYDHPGVNGFFHGGVMIMKYDNFVPEAICQSTSVEMEADGDVSLNVNDIVDIDPCWYSSITSDYNSIDCSKGQEVLVTLSMTDNNSNVTTCETYVNIFDEFGTCCPDTLYVHRDPLMNTRYMADSLLLSDRIVESQSNVKFTAFKGVHLKPGFEVVSGAVFEAINHGCSFETTFNRSYISTADTDYLDCGTIPALVGSSEMTIEFWYKASAQSEEKLFISQEENVSNRIKIGTGSNSVENDFLVNIGNSAVWVEDVITVGQWNYWTVSYNGNAPNEERVTIYKDGVPQQTIISQIIPSQLPAINTNFHIGENMEGDQLDEIGVYNYAKVYIVDEFGNVRRNLTSCDDTCSPDLIAFYNMQQDASQGSFFDVSSSNHASIVSADSDLNASTDAPELNCYQ